MLGVWGGRQPNLQGGVRGRVCLGDRTPFQHGKDDLTEKQSHMGMSVCRCNSKNMTHMSDSR